MELLLETPYVEWIDPDKSASVEESANSYFSIDDFRPMHSPKIRGQPITSAKRVSED
jgi:hypothetical protein